MKTSEVEDRYFILHAQALSLIDDIKDMVEDMPAPSENTDWGDVGDMACLVESLNSIAHPEK